MFLLKDWKIGNKDTKLEKGSQEVCNFGMLSSM